MRSVVAITSISCITTLVVFRYLSLIKKVVAPLMDGVLGRRFDVNRRVEQSRQQRMVNAVKRRLGVDYQATLALPNQIDSKKLSNALQSPPLAYFVQRLEVRTDNRHKSVQNVTNVALLCVLLLSFYAVTRPLNELSMMIALASLIAALIGILLQKRQAKLRSEVHE